MKYKVLVVDDEKLLRWSLVQKLQEWGYKALEARTGREALHQYATRVPDLVILDLRLPDMNGLDVLRTLHEEDPELPILIITAYGGVDEAVEAMKAGAADFFSKPLDFTKLQIAVERSLENLRLKRKLRELESDAAPRWSLDLLVAESPAMQAVVRDVRKILNAQPGNILITGESGTGKDLLARILHHESERAAMPFIIVDCAAIPETLMESELFGYERGAFTDAKTGKKGAFLLADGGTLVLDEIGELKPALQVKLLRVLEDRAFRPLGGTSDISVNVRVIAITNRNLEEMVRRGAFREDLYFRLNVVRIHLPPLRDRVEDILPLAHFFIQQFNLQFRRHVEGLTPAAERQLQQHPWPGNVRELRNTIERAMILHDVKRLDASHLALVPPAQPILRGFDLPPEGINLQELEEHLLIQALRRARGNKTRAAQLLGLSRDAFRYRLKRLEEQGRLRELDSSILTASG